MSEIQTLSPLKPIQWDQNFFQKQDEANLAALGYEQQLRRNWTLTQNFGISFSVMSVITGITTLFQYGLAVGGPAAMSVGWIVVSFFSIFIALSMAEILSSCPMSGGPYFWSATLAPAWLAPFVSWVTGWFHLLGQVAVTTGIAYSLAQLMSTAAMVKTSYDPTPAKNLILVAVILVSWVLLNSYGRSSMVYFLNLAIALNSFGVMAITIAILAKAPEFRSASFVFTQIIDYTGAGNTAGWSVRASTGYVVCIGCLTSQFALLGYDASSHVSEETQRASWSAPLGTFFSVVASTILGLSYLLALLFTMDDVDIVLESSYDQPVLQILVDLFGENGALVLFVLIMICVWHCGLFCLMSNSRMIFAFSRDSGLPRAFSRVNERYLCPVRAIWFGAFLSFCFALPSLGSAVAFTAVTSIATIGILISYGLPISMMIIYHKNFKVKRGPFNLGIASRGVGIIAVGWIAFICIILCLPTATPVTIDDFNFAPLALVAVFLWAVGTWPFVKKRFVGPTREQFLLIDRGNLCRRSN